ncbi:hypothetical protein ACQQ2Q_10150 [Agrobacterium sp. ES01]|uniref:hypothetical protein n=1 Tax=Agrobacterium sp. ES01 TaxID=3420714 RepID=UPI003D135CB9
MDALSLIYYALVCGGLAFLVPGISSKPLRIGIGLVTGAVSALILPFIKSLI